MSDNNAWVLEEKLTFSPYQSFVKPEKKDGLKPSFIFVLPQAD